MRGQENDILQSKLNTESTKHSQIYARVSTVHIHVTLGAIQVLRNADGGGGVSDFLEKSVTKV